MFDNRFACLTVILTALCTSFAYSQQELSESRLLALKEEAKKLTRTLATMNDVVEESARRLDVNRLVSIDANLQVTGQWPKSLIAQCEKDGNFTTSELSTLNKNLSAIPEVAAEKVFTLSHDLVQRMFEHHIALVLLDLNKRVELLPKFTLEKVTKGEDNLRKTLFRLINEMRRRFGIKGLLRLTVGDSRPYRSYRDETNLMNLHGKRLALPSSDADWLKKTIGLLQKDESLAFRTKNIIITALRRVSKGVDEDTNVKPRTILGAVVRAREEQRRAYLQVVSALRKELNGLLLPRMRKIATYQVTQKEK